MKLKDYIGIIKKLYKAKGCIIITKIEQGACATRFGNFTNNDIDNYLKGFNHGN